jgi:hypothetical protein
MKRRMILNWRLISVLLLSFLVSAPGLAVAQKVPTSLKRIGVLSSFTRCPVSADHAVRRNLVELGWVEGKNVVYDCVFAEGGALTKLSRVLWS